MGNKNARKKSLGRSEMYFNLGFKNRIYWTKLDLECCFHQHKIGRSRGGRSKQHRRLQGVCSGRAARGLSFSSFHTLCWGSELLCTEKSERWRDLELVPWKGCSMGRELGLNLARQLGFGSGLPSHPSKRKDWSASRIHKSFHLRYFAYCAPGAMKIY